VVALALDGDSLVFGYPGLVPDCVAGHVVETERTIDPDDWARMQLVALREAFALANRLGLRLRRTAGFLEGVDSRLAVSPGFAAACEEFLRADCKASADPAGLIAAYELFTGRLLDDFA
jgi:hypothetical protein